MASDPRCHHGKHRPDTHARQQDIQAGGHVVPVVGAPCQPQRHLDRRLDHTPWPV